MTVVMMIREREWWSKMKPVKTLGMCLAAVLAAAAMLATTAMAQGPEWGRCAKQKHGKYTDASCLNKAEEKKGVFKGKYEWTSLKEEEEKFTEPRCLPQKKGNYTESACKTVAEKKGVPDHKGKFEKVGPYFTGTGGTGILNTVLEACYKFTFEGEGFQEAFINERRAECDHLNNKAENGTASEYVECASEQNSGRALGTDEVADVKVTFKGCLFAGAAPCTNTGKEGEISVNALKGRLGYLEKAVSPAKVGILLEPEAGGAFVTFNCLEGLFEFTVGVGNNTEGMYYEGTGHDSIIAPITPIDQPASGFEEVFKDNGEPAENEPSHFEGEGSVIHRLEAATTLHEEEGERHDQWAAAGQSVRNLSFTEGTVEIRG